MQYITRISPQKKLYSGRKQSDRHPHARRHTMTSGPSPYKNLPLQYQKTPLFKAIYRDAIEILGITKANRDGKSVRRQLSNTKTNIMINYSVRQYVPTALGGQDSTYYKAMAQYTATMDLNEFAQHIASHGTVYGRADIAAVLTLAVDCIRELVLEGYRITLGDLGTFYAKLSSNSVEDKADFTSDDITKCVIGWGRNQMFTNLIDDAEFNQVLTRAEQAAALAASKVSGDLTGELEAISGAVSSDDSSDSSDDSSGDSSDDGSNDEEA